LRGWRPLEELHTLRMYPFDYKISLHIFHPDLDPDDISKALSLLPDGQRKSGEQKRTPKGDLLEGIWSDSYWWKVFPHADGVGMGNSLEQVVNKLLAPSPWFRSLVESGGTVRIKVAWYSPAMSGEILSARLICKIAECGLDLEFAIYAVDQHAGSRD